MKKYLLVLLFYVISIFGCHKVNIDEPLTQVETVNSYNECGTPEVMKIQIAKNPKIIKDIEELKRKSILYKGRNNGSNSRFAGTLYVALVIHIVLPNPDIVTDEQIKSQIDVLNNDYNKANAELTNPNIYLAGYNFESVANCNIHFIQAEVVRKQTTTAFFTDLDDDAVKQNSLGGSNAVSPENRLNIWVCDLRTPETKDNGKPIIKHGNNNYVEIGGYAYHPFTVPASQDGLVINYHRFGTLTPTTYSLNPSQNKGRTTTHELGHWLNLEHIWGDAFCGDDYIADTHQQDAPNFGCPNTNLKSKCEEKLLEQWMNYMDYSDGVCRYMFTNGQKLWMDAAIENGRAAYFSQTLQILKDIDGNVYNTVTIGTQVWMAENLKTTKYRNGDPIPNVTDNTAWAALSTGAYCWYNNDATTYKATYGGLYNWYAAIDSRNIAPAGWHVPTDAEWTTLTTFLGGVSVAYGPLKETGTTHWASPNTGATNSSGFTALPGGYRDNGPFYVVGSNGYWWSSTAYEAGYAWDRFLGYNYAGVGRGYGLNEQYGMSVRCVQD